MTVESGAMAPDPDRTGHSFGSPRRVKEVMPMSSHGLLGITTEVVSA